IPLEFQEIKHQPFPMAQPNEKGAVSSPYCGSETNASPKKQGSVIVRGCFISTARWTYGLFLQFSHRRTSWLRHFIGYSLGTSKKKVSTIFMAQPKTKDVSCRIPRREAGEASRRYADEVRPAFKGFFKGCVIENG
ncbi:hypothetical protein, partial [uncultured Bilophila sp.]|uniref:hypothetical protein n=1 Tax=uncultured Bilophila sp. TaxID=529385 RepID=UPI00266EE040